MREPCARQTTAVAAWPQPAVLLTALIRQLTQLAEAQKRRAALRHALWQTAASRHEKHLCEPPLAGMHRRPRYGTIAVFLKHRSTTAGDKNKFVKPHLLHSFGRRQSSAESDLPVAAAAVAAAASWSSWCQRVRCGQGYGGQTGTRRLGTSARARLAAPVTQTRLPVGAQND